MTASPFALGQFETPLDAADLLLGFSLRRPTDRVLDPSCGAGLLLRRAYAWQEWLAPGPHDMDQACWYGIELDELTAAVARSAMPQATILHQNFFTLDSAELAPFDVVVGNPPYTRAQAIGTIETTEARQMALFPEGVQAMAAGKMPLLTRSLAGALNGRSGLYAYFFLHSATFLREGGRLAFIVPNGWLDVAYGASLKRFLLEHFRVRTIIESGVERWFATARVNTCLIILEKCGHVQRRRNNLIHLVRLRQETASLLPPADDYRRLVEVEQLVAHLSPGRDMVSEEAVVHVLPQKELRAEDKWGIALRAPAAYQRARSKLTLASLHHWLKVERGYTTGANEFFYLAPAEVREWSLEKQFRRPLLKSLRGLDRLRLTAEDSRTEVLLVPAQADLRDTAVSAYIRWGEEQGFSQRTSCAAREPWYSLLPQEPAPLVMPKGIWRRHAVPLLLDGTAVDQQLYQLYPAEEVSVLAAAALLNSAWFALQIELHGRVNFGKGLLWLAAYELEQIRLPDPRRLTFAQIAGLEEAVLPLTERTLGDSLAELDQPDRQALDKQVFDILGFSAQERVDVLQALAERMSSRRRRAQSED